MTLSCYPRDLARLWTQSAQAALAGLRPHIAVQFVINYEEGGENSILHGDLGLRSLPVRDRRRPALAGTAAHEHGIHLRVWLACRLLALMAAFYANASLPVTVFGVATAMARNKDAVAGHADRWDGRLPRTDSNGSTIKDFYGRRRSAAHILEAIRLHTQGCRRAPAWLLPGTHLRSHAWHRHERRGLCLFGEFLCR